VRASAQVSAQAIMSEATSEYLKRVMGGFAIVNQNTLRQRPVELGSSDGFVSFRKQ
jgi:hypothetical protein